MLYNLEGLVNFLPAGTHYGQGQRLRDQWKLYRFKQKARHGLNNPHTQRLVHTCNRVSSTVESKKQQSTSAHTQRVYLDTSCLFSIDGDVEQTVQKLLYRLERSNIDIIIPQTVLGEIMAVTLRDTQHMQRDQKIQKIVEILIKTLDKYNIDAKHCLPPPQERTDKNRSAIDIAFNLMKNDEYLDPTDTLILAQALADPESTHLYTTDSVLIESTEVEKINQELKMNGMRKTILNIGIS